jgi:predicted glycoside hydrolase/deacetylase ChbG (UPF0249 family)
LRERAVSFTLAPERSAAGLESNSSLERRNSMDSHRCLLVVADDYGIGPETSRAILELAQVGVVTGTVLLVNSPHAESAVRAWRAADVDADLGWHPCLTMDAPIAPSGEVASLVNRNGCMGPLGWFLRRLLLGGIRPEHVRRELEAQRRRFRELTGHEPGMVNSHQHVAVFSPVGAILRDVLRSVSPRPFLRRVVEPWSTWSGVPGARFKRAVLTVLGKRQAAWQDSECFRGADGLAGITDPVYVRDPRFFARWLSSMPGQTVELMCHPGYFDDTLVGRDCRAGDGLQQRRVDELYLLRQPEFPRICGEAGFVLARPSQRMQAGRKDVA